MINGRFKLLVDGACPLCRREGELLRRLDRGRGRLVIENISDPGFNPAIYGKTRDELLDRIHGVTADGRVVTGMEAFREAYQAVGLGLLLAPTRWPMLRQMSDAAYHWFARNRYRLTGRTRCHEGHCRVS